jgi:hypothetical protein
MSMIGIMLGSKRPIPIPEEEPRVYVEQGGKIWHKGARHIRQKHEKADQPQGHGCGRIVVLKRLEDVPEKGCL